MEKRKLTPIKILFLYIGTVCMISVFLVLGMNKIEHSEFINPIITDILFYSAIYYFGYLIYFFIKREIKRIILFLIYILFICVVLFLNRERYQEFYKEKVKTLQFKTTENKIVNISTDGRISLEDHFGLNVVKEYEIKENSIVIVRAVPKLKNEKYLEENERIEILTTSETDKNFIKKSLKIE